MTIELSRTNRPNYLRLNMSCAVSSRAVLGQRILAVDVKLPRLLSGVSSATFKRKLRGARIDAVNRRGKYILVELDSLDVLLVHLRMTGKFLCVGSEQALPPYPHVVFIWMMTAGWCFATCGSLAGCVCWRRRSFHAPANRSAGAGAVH